MAETRIPDPESDPGISITRVFDAPRERVWREWVEPEAFADWFGGTATEIPLDTVEMDVREGGSWKATMLPPGGRKINWIGEYLEVSEPERLVLTMTDRPDDPERALITVVLTALGDGRTEMLMEQRSDDLTPEQLDAASKGWGSFFDRLEARLAESG